MIPSAPSQAQGPGSAQARRFRCDVGPREVHGERRRTARDPHLRVLAEDAVDRRGLRPGCQDRPPLPRVRERCRATEQRMEWRHLEPDGGRWACFPDTPGLFLYISEDEFKLRLPCNRISRARDD